MDEYRPLSIGQVLDRGFSIYRRSLASVVALSIAAALLPNLVRLFYNPEEMIKGGHFSAGASSYFLLIFVLSFAALAFWIAVIRKLDDVDSGRNQLSAMEALKGGLRYYFPVLGVSILVGMVVMLGFILLIVPGIILGVSLSLYLFPVVLDGSRITEALERSRGLVRGHWWRTSAILTVMLLIYLAVVMGFSMVFGMLLAMGGAMSTVAGSQGPGTLAELLTALLLAGLNSLLMPLFYAVMLATYRDLQLRQSGGDLASRIAAAA